MQILLAVFTWYALLILTWRNKSFSVFVLISLSFSIGLSVLVTGMFVQWFAFNSITILSPLVIFIWIIGVLWRYIYSGSISIWDIVSPLKEDILHIRDSFFALATRKRCLIIFVSIYCLVKITMAFTTNIHMPTYDEDAVAWWDMKTKIFTYNHSLILDKTSPEYLGSDLSRLPMAWLIDSYFLLTTQSIVWYTNIISPLVLLMSFLLLLWFLYKKTDLLYAFIYSYIYISLPFIFVHSIGSYWNFPTWYFLVTIAVLLISSDHRKFSYAMIIAPIIFMLWLIRNESLITIFIVLISYIWFYIAIQWKAYSFQFVKKTIVTLFASLVLSFIASKLIVLSYPSAVEMNTWWVWLSWGMFASILKNIGESGVLGAPFSQAFYHTDYLLLFMVYLLGLLYWIYSLIMQKKRMYMINDYIIWLSLVLLLLYLIVLYSNVQWLGLLTHFAFIRYPVWIVVFIVLASWLSLYPLYDKINQWC